MRRGRRIPIFFCLFFVGCTSTLTKPEFDQKSRETVNPHATLTGHVYYRGTKDGYDYFKFESSFGFGSERARVLEGEVELQQRFMLTGKGDRWIVLRSLPILSEQQFPDFLYSTNLMVDPSLDRIQ